MFERVKNKEIFEFECEKGFFIAEISYIEEEILYELFYKSSADSCITLFLIGTNIAENMPVDVFLENEVDTILNSDYYDNCIEEYSQLINSSEFC